MLARLRATPLTVLDLGTAGIRCLVARPRPSRGFGLLARSLAESRGLRAGAVTDADAARRAVAEALEAAEEQAGERLSRVVVVGAAGRPRSRTVRVDVPLQGNAVRDSHIRRALHEAVRIARQPGETALHAVPVEGTVDGRTLRDPRGMRGERLELLATVVLADADALAALVDLVESCHVVVEDVIAAPYAAATAALTEDEAERGALVLDFGAGTTSAAHVADGRLLFTYAVPYGSVHLTHDLAYGLGTSRRAAERIKVLNGHLFPPDGDARVDVPAADGEGIERTAPLAEIATILRARIEEILDFLAEGIEAQRDLFDGRPPRAVVLTGGGAQLEGLVELAERVFGLPVRRARLGLVFGPQGIEDDPSLAAASGALALASGDDGGLSFQELGRRPPGGLLGRLARWFVGDD
ncbi:Cell division protein FtsA [bacterium HR39]|nr:Cell division protein FtsA [bacterium HR39]